MRALPCLLLLSVLATSACDGSLDALESLAAGATAERPEGWESLEGEESALRLYYQFVDAQRRVRFVERLEDVPEPLRATVGFVKLDVAPPLSPGEAARVRQARRSGDAGGPTAPESGASRIVLYSAEWCGACSKAKRHLARRGVDYEERDVDEPRWADELHRVTGARAVPVIDVDGRMLTGFSPSGYDALLDS